MISRAFYFVPLLNLSLKMELYSDLVFEMKQTQGTKSTLMVKIQNMGTLTIE